MSDLVKRLHRPCQNTDFNGQHCKQRKDDKKWWCLHCLAADEIERQAKRIAELQKHINAQANYHMASAKRMTVRIEELESTTVTTEYHDHIVNEALVEIERLRAALDTAEDKLHHIRQWCNAYPRTVFIEPTKKQWAEANKVLEAHKPDCPSLTAISGSNMRHVVEGIAKIAALKGVESNE